jgi:hypothetical protein
MPMLGTPAPDSSPTTQNQILEAVKALLLRDLGDIFTEKNLAISDEEEPPSGLKAYYYGQIWVLGGEFEDGVYVGAGKQGVLERGGISITVWRKHEKDQAGRADSLMLQPDTGLLELKRRILKAMVTNARLQWQQTFILVDEMRPTRSDHPRVAAYGNGNPVAGDIFLEFSTPFIWDLS